MKTVSATGAATRARFPKHQGAGRGKRILNSLFLAAFIGGLLSSGLFCATQAQPFDPGEKTIQQVERFGASPLAADTASSSSGWKIVTISDLPDGAGLGRIWARSTNEAYLWAYRTLAAEPEAILYRWQDGQWRRLLTFAGSEPGAIHGTGTSDVFLALRDTKKSVSRVLRSTDNGQTFEDQLLPAAVSGNGLGDRALGDFSGTPNNIHLNVHVPGGKAHMAHFDGSAWQVVFSRDSYGIYAHSTISPTETYFVSCWATGMWNGVKWTESRLNQTFCDAFSTWASRDAAGLHWYAAGHNNFANGMRVWKHNEATGKFDLVLQEGSGSNIGSVNGIWGSSPRDIYVIGGIAATSNGSRIGRIYHSSNGTSWKRLTDVESMAAKSGAMPHPNAVSGSGPDDVWIVLRDGRLLHRSVQETPPLPPSTNQIFMLGKIPNATVAQGKSLEFEVHAISATETIAMSLDSAPNGSVTYDRLTKLFKFVPSPLDRNPFRVRFTSTSGATQEITITIDGKGPATPEEMAFGMNPVRSIPDPASEDYVVRNDTVNAGEELFNTELRKTSSGVIMGKTIVFERGHANGLFESYHDRSDLKRLSIHAETLIFKSALSLPQTDVTIYAREIRFEDTRQTTYLSTTPRSIPNRASAADGSKPGRDGADGLKAGDIQLFVGTITASPGQKRFRLNGGNGQSAGLGRDGIDGQSVTPYSHFTGCRDFKVDGNSIGIWFKQTTCTGSKCNSAQPSDRWIPGANGHHDFKETSWPTSGTDAVSAGRPGNGGSGGKFVSNLSLSTMVDATGGVAGEQAKLPVGGRAGTPSPAKIYYFGCEGGRVLWERVTVSGKNGVAPAARVPLGSNGRIETKGNPLSFLSPEWVRLSLAHAKDTYLFGHYSAAENGLLDLLSLIRNAKVGSSWTAIAPEWQSEFNGLEAEIGMLTQRLSSNLDFYGKPAGWVPMLSFEANFNLFRSEIESAIRTLFLTYWINNSANSLEKRVKGAAAAAETLKLEVSGARTQLTDIGDAFPLLETEFIAHAANTERMQTYLKQLEASLLARAADNVNDRNKVEGWKKSLKVAAAALSVVPVYQPALGAIGQGMKIIADYDGNDDPVKTAKELWGLRSAFKPDKLKSSMESWKSELNKLDLQNFTLKNSSYLKALEPYGKALEAGYEAFRKLNTQTQAPADEVEAELQRLKASDQEFKKAVDDLSMLMAERELLAKRIADVLQTVGRLTETITHNLLAIDALNQDRALALSALDERALGHLKEMDRRARARLLKYHYFLARAFEYRFLEPYVGDLRLDRLFDKFRLLLQQGRGVELNAEDFASLRAIYEEELSSIAEGIVDRYIANPPEKSLRIPIQIPPEDLVLLSSGTPIKVNLKGLGGFLPSEENVRIANLEVGQPELGVKFPKQPFAFKLRLSHSGISKLTFKGKDSVWRHYDSMNRTPIRWGIRVNGDFSISPEAPSDGTKSLLYALLSNSGLQEHIVLFSRPAVNADLEISLETPSPQHLVEITNLVLRLSYDYAERSSEFVTLNIDQQNNILPEVSVSVSDQSGRTDGRGSFQRHYRKGTKVVIGAPPEYGEWKFERWAEGSGRSPSSEWTNPTLQLVLLNDLRVYPVYTKSSAREKTHHSADINKNFKVEPVEAARGLSYLQAGAYHADSAGIDGFAPGVGSTTGYRHDADFAEPFWRIQVSEAARLLGYLQANGYHPDPLGLDGFAPGPITSSKALALNRQAIAATATHVASPVDSNPSRIRVTNTFSYGGKLLSLLWRLQIPSNFELIKGTVTGPGSPQAFGNEILWTSFDSLPESPITMVYEIQVKDKNGTKQLTAEVEYQTSGSVNPSRIAVEPNPLRLIEEQPPSDQPSATFRATQSSGSSYSDGAVVTITNRIEFSGKLISLRLEANLPEDWSIINVAGPGDPRAFGREILWTTLDAMPSSPFGVE